MALALLVLVIAVLPAIVAKTSLRNALLARAVPGGIVRVTAADASLSWISGPSLAGVEVVDASNAPLLAAERISLGQSPISLALNSRDVGVIEVIRPTIHIKVRPDGSNIEDAIGAIVSAITPSDGQSPTEVTAAAPTRFALSLLEGTVIVDDEVTGEQWRLESVNVQYDNRTSGSRIAMAAISGRLVQQVKGGSTAAAGSFSAAIEPAEGGRGLAKLQTEGVSLAAAEPWLRRFATGVSLRGTLSGQGSATWTIPTVGVMPNDLTTNGSLSIAQLDATASALQGDRVRLARLDMPWRITAQEKGWRIEELRILGGIANLAVRGFVDPKTEPAQHQLEMVGGVNLAQLAAMLPHALHVREGTTITSGEVEFAAKVQPTDGVQLITGSIRTTPLAASHDGQDVRWDEPVRANFALRRSPSVFQLDSLRCDSQFLKIDAAGTPQQFAANASFDLNRLAERLGQFLDLSGIELAGTGTAKASWHQSGADQFTASAVGDLTQLQVSLGEGGTWSEPQLAIRGELAGLLDPASKQATRVDIAKLQINGQGDTLDAQLMSAVQLTTESSGWPVTLKATGRIARWLTRVRPWFSTDPWHIDGQSELVATMRVASNAFDIGSVKLIVNDLQATAPGWNIREPRVEVAGDARWNGNTGEVASGSAQLVTSTVTVASRDIRITVGNSSIKQLTGSAAYRADLTRLAAWRQAEAGKPAQFQPAGEVTGNLRFAQNGDRMTGELHTTGQNIALAKLTVPPGPGASAGYQTIWQEPNLAVRGVAGYQSSTDRLAFDQFQIQSNTLQATAVGGIDQLSTKANVNLTGTLNYDLAQVSQLLRPYVGEGIQLSGREQARFAMTGALSEAGGPKAQLASVNVADPYRVTNLAMPATGSGVHWSRRVKAELELPWGGANVYGLPVGPGRLVALLGDGAVRVEPLTLAIGEGTLTAAPLVRFDPPPSELTLPAGPLLTNVRISPEVSEAMLKYVAPILAGATQSEGQFSITLDGTRVPLVDSKKADVAGRLDVHSVRVVPGALANQLIGVVQQVEALAKRRDPAGLASKPQVTLLSIRDQQVNFRVMEGRVHHQNLEFQVNDITMRSQGSVGLDQTVQLTLQLPVPDSWVAKEPLLAGLKGQSLQIPVSGTLTRPQIDARAIANLSQQLLQGAAQQAIGGELNKALDKLFKSK